MLRPNQTRSVYIQEDGDIKLWLQHGGVTKSSKICVQLLFYKSLEAYL